MNDRFEDWRLFFHNRYARGSQRDRELHHIAVGSEEWMTLFMNSTSAMQSLVGLKGRFVNRFSPLLFIQPVVIHPFSCGESASAYFLRKLSFRFAPRRVFRGNNRLVFSDSLGLRSNECNEWL